LQKLNRDHRTVKRFLSDLDHRRTRSDKGLIKEVSVAFHPPLTKAHKEKHLHWV